MISEQDVWNALPTHNGSFLRLYCTWASGHTDAPIAFHALSGLAMMSACAPASLAVPATIAGGPYHANLFALVVGMSGQARKTHAVSMARKMLDGTVPGLAVPLPGSKEQMITEIATDRPQALYVEPEFGSFLKSAKGNTYLAPMKTVLTDLYDCHPIHYRTRKTAYTQEHPRVSFLTAVSYAYLEEHTEGPDWEGGFLSRFLTFAASRERTYITAQPEDPALREWLRARLVAARDVRPGPCMGLAPAALDMYGRWALAKEDAANAGNNRRTSGQEARTPTFALKIALLNAFFDGWGWAGEPWMIDAASMATGIGLANLHTQTLSHLAGELAPSRDLRDRRRVLACIPADGTPVALSEVMRDSGVGLYRRVNEVVESLTQEGLVHRASINGHAMFMRTTAGGATGTPQGHLVVFDGAEGAGESRAKRV
jgi:hypothetical protein